MTTNVLVLIDIQKEYTTVGRPFYLSGIDKSLDKCRRLLSFARREKWEIAHVQHSNGDAATRFNPNSEYYKFADGFEPLPGERHFVKEDYSCYSSREFAHYMEQLEREASNSKSSPNIYLIGYNTVMCCLSTLEEARRRKQSGVHFVSDASYAKALPPRYSEEDAHAFLVALFEIKKLAEIVSTEKVIEYKYHP
jgi:nicotinamidase-related amidase